MKTTNNAPANAIPSFALSNIHFETRSVRVSWNNIQQPGAVFYSANEAMNYIWNVNGHIRSSKGYVVNYPGGVLDSDFVSAEMDRRYTELCS